MGLIKCPSCGKEMLHHAKGVCITCYKKLYWKPKKAICKRCGRLIKIHAKGLCPGCYNYVFHLDNVKNQNYKKWYNIGIDVYKERTKECLLCGFNKVVELHHLDRDRKNNSKTNLIGLCPNHHKMAHNFKYAEEIKKKIKEKFPVKLHSFV